MPGTLLINAAEAEQTRAAYVEQGRIQEYHVERAEAQTLVGNVYKGRIVNIEAGIGAAFLDIGVGSNAFLHASDAVDGTLAAVGESIVLQVTRDAKGDKGPVATTDISLPGRFTVLLPCADRGGVSRRIPDGAEREKLRALATEIEQHVGGGIILRTVAADQDREAVIEDARRLVRLWEGIASEAATARAPALLFAESDLATRAIRDMAGDDVERIVVDSPGALERARVAIARMQPDLLPLLHLHERSTPLFHAYGIEGQVDELQARRVALPSGGWLGIDHTEALIAVDVNSGRTRHEDGLEETAFRTNLEAAYETARQLRLRDLGGVIVVDFIDMLEAEHIAGVESEFKRALRADRVHLRPGRLGDFGVFVLTRRQAGGGNEGCGTPCPHCDGRGRLAPPGDVALRIWRELAARAAEPGGPLEVSAHPAVLAALTERRGESVERLPRRVSLRPDPGLGPGGWRI